MSYKNSFSHCLPIRWYKKWLVNSLVFACALAASFVAISESDANIATGGEAPMVEDLAQRATATCYLTANTTNIPVGATMTYTVGGTGIPANSPARWEGANYGAWDTPPGGWELPRVPSSFSLTNYGPLQTGIYDRSVKIFDPVTGILICQTNLLRFVFQPATPNEQAAVVARDLNIPGLGFVGHIGVWDNEAKTVIDSPNVAGPPSEVFPDISNYIWANNWAHFSAQSKVWSTISARIPSFYVESCFNDRCTEDFAGVGTYFPDRVKITAGNAVIRRARQIKAIGGDYTVATIGVPSQPRLVSRTGVIISAAMRGRYRCDHIVKDIYAYTRGIAKSFNPDINWRPIPLIYDRPSDWPSRVNTSILPASTPSALYNAIKVY